MKSVYIIFQNLVTESNICHIENRLMQCTEIIDVLNKKCDQHFLQVKWRVWGY